MQTASTASTLSTAFWAKYYCSKVAAWADNDPSVIKPLKEIQTGLNNGSFSPNNLGETCLIEIKELSQSRNLEAAQLANTIINDHLMPRAVAAEEVKRSGILNFIVANRLSNPQLSQFPQYPLLPTDLSALISEYQPDCHTLTSEGKQCGMGADANENGGVDDFEFTDTESKSTSHSSRSCRAECLGDLCPAWLNTLITKVPTRVAISAETEGGIENIYAVVNHLNLKIGPTKWTFDTNPGSTGYADVKENREGLLAVGCRILHSGKALDLEAQIYLNGDQLAVRSSVKFLPHTISFPELEGKQYFVRNNQWSAKTIERYGGHEIVLSAKIHIGTRRPTSPSLPPFNSTGSVKLGGTKRNQPSSSFSSSSSSSKSMRGRDEQKWSSNATGENDESGDGGGGGGSGEPESKVRTWGAGANRWNGSPGGSGNLENLYKLFLAAKSRALSRESIQ